jgi:hypothetical protein
MVSASATSSTASAIALACPERIEDVLDADLLPLEDGLAESEPRIDDHVGPLVTAR